MSELLPDSWASATIGAVTVETLQRVPHEDEIFTYIDISSINRETKTIATPQRLPGQNAPSRARKVVQSGDVLVSMTRPNLNAVAFVPEELHEEIASTGFEVLRAQGLDQRWLYYLVRTSEFVEAMSSLVQGALYPAIRSKDVRSFVIPVAPFDEQKRVADKLEVLLKRVDRCREKLDRVPLILKRFRQSVLAAATSGALTEDWRMQHPDQVSANSLSRLLRATHAAAGGHKAGNAAAPTEDVHDLIAEMFPEGWELIELREVVLPTRPITYGILKPGPELPEGVKYIRVADFPNDRLNLSSVRNTSHSIDQNFKRSKLAEGDILLSIRGTVGRLIVIPPVLEGANITQDSARLSVQPQVNRNYVLWFLRSNIAQQRMKKSEKGVAVRGINIGDVRALQVPLPSRTEQDVIVGRIEKLLAFADGLEARYTAARDQVERLIPALLAKAFRGELVEQDPNDEPASVLLERIKAERAAQAETKLARGRNTKTAG